MQVTPPPGSRGWVWAGLLVLTSALATACGSGTQPAGPDDDDDDLTPVGRDAGRPDAPVDRAPIALDGPAPPRASPGPWEGRDVGMVGQARGRFSFGGGGFSVRGGGADVDGMADAFHFVFQNVRGDIDLVARVRSLQMSDPMAKAGLMIRAGAGEAAAANVFLAVLGDVGMGGRLQHRAVAGGATSALPPDAYVRAGQYLRLVRAGRTFTAYRTSDRAAGWVKVGAVQVDLPAEVAVGVAVTSRVAAMTTNAEFDFLRLVARDAAGTTRGWNLEELSGTAATALVAGSDVTLAGAGDVPTSTGEVGPFAYFPATEAVSLTARLTALPDVTPNARAGLMFRVGMPGDLSRGAPHAALFLTQRGQVLFQARVPPSLNADPAPIMENFKPPLWLRLERSVDPTSFASVVSGAVSADGTQWVPIGQAPLPLTEPFLAGMSLTTGANSVVGTATFTNVTVSTPVAPPPPPPDAGAGDR